MGETQITASRARLGSSTLQQVQVQVQVFSFFILQVQVQVQ